MDSSQQNQIGHLLNLQLLAMPTSTGQLLLALQKSLQQSLNLDHCQVLEQACRVLTDTRDVLEMHRSRQMLIR